jgi:putative ABC transport system ATP-binding protein
LSQFLLGPFQLFAYANGQFAQSRASAQRVAEVLATAPAVTGGDGAAPASAGRLKFRGVRYGSLRRVDLDIQPGQLIGVVATDPAHATDLLMCLGREVDPSGGRILLDDHDLSTLDPAAVRSAILVAAHDAVLFEGSLLDNVSAAARGPVDAAMVAAAADQVASSLPDGVHSAVSERGQSLSGGQRQRVALARALAAEPDVLVVHDPTTAVDSVTEAQIARRLRQIRGGKTTLVLATSPALLAETDRVVVLHHGVIIAVKAHADLVRDHDLYRGAVFS